ncbi:MAG: phosphatidylethanolamine N-methyltransferase family protein [Myxococcales bacterium]|nr:phosphatidylethanolamine N-methyltransferase family protein [Myxococcales bacterium]
MSHTAWRATEPAFLTCHATGLNAALHAVTTPLGLLGALALVATPWPPAALGVAVLYAASLLGRIPLRVWTATTLALMALAAIAMAWPWPWPVALAMLLVAYGLQEAAHWITCEPTLQSTYQGRTGWLWDLAVHSWLLLPLVLVAAARHLSVVRALLPRVRIVDGRLPDARHPDIEHVRRWVADNEPSTAHTTHWWFHDTPQAVQEALQRLASDPHVLGLFRDAHPGCDVEIVHEMNEIYVSGPENEATSDTVFYTPHVDGPFAIWPGATVYRSLVGITENTRVQTLFVHPTRHAEPLAYTLTQGELLAFDFNRELHFIRTVPDRSDPDQRCVLKVHYVVYPKGMATYGRLLGRLTGLYDQRARQLFLSTLAPSTLWERLKAAAVLGTTRAFDAVVRHIGWGNLAYVTALAAVSLLTGSLLPLLVGASFVHYLLYLGVFEFRSAISFGQFKRDVVFFKAVSTAQLVGLFLWSWTPDPVALGLMAVGYGLATSATLALGVDRTYFGVELGQLPPKRIDRFPFGVIPHPMIVGAIVGLLGFHLVEPLRAYAPWLIPTHIAFYLLHLVQEITDEHATANRRAVVSD